MLHVIGICTFNFIDGGNWCALTNPNIQQNHIVVMMGQFLQLVILYPRNQKQ